MTEDFYCEDNTLLDDLPSLFHDLAPIQQDDGPYPVCAIDYSPEFSRAMDYLRAALRADDRTERSLRLTAFCLKQNPANYTIWHFRRRCLAALSQEAPSSTGKQMHVDASVDLPEEFFYYDSTIVERDLNLASKLGGNNPKNYQIWYHRRSLLERLFTTYQTSGNTDTKLDILKKASMELTYVAGVLMEDGKNYHAWSHRQWIVRTINDANLWIEEKEFAHGLISEDPRNNSAWNQCWFVSHKGITSQPLTQEEARAEANYALQGAAIDPYNESPWRYFVAILKESPELIADFEGEVLKMKEVLNSCGHDSNGCSNLISAHIDILEMKKDTGANLEAANYAHDLALVHDKIRKKYWLQRERDLRSKC